MNKVGKAIAGGLVLTPFVILLVALMVIGYVFADGYVVKHAWDWLMVSQFGVAPLSFKAACSLAVMWGILAFRTEPVKDVTPKETGKRILSHYFGLLMLLLTSYCIHRFMKG